MNKIDSRAILGDNVDLGEDNIIYPNVYIEDGVSIGSGNVIMPNSVIYKGTSIGDGNKIHAGSVLGDLPQDISFQGVESFVKIGNNNVVRECVTINRGTDEGSATVIGNDNFFMGYTHIAHNCDVGDGVISVNGAVIGGHVTIEDYAFLSANIAIHQFCRVGKYSMLGGVSAINQDIPPFMTCGGRPARVNTINVVGLKRAGFKPEVRKEIKLACKILFFSGLNIPNALSKIEQNCSSEEALSIVQFVQGSSRGIVSGEV